MDFITALRLQQMFGNVRFGQQPIGNDLPSQGGITGSLGTNQPSTQNIFAPDKSQMVQTPMDSGGNQFPINAPDLIGGDNQNIYDRIQKMFPQQHEAADMMKQYLASMPDRKKYEPGKWQKFFDRLIAVGGASGPAGYTQNGSPYGFKFNPEVAQKVQSGLEDKAYNDAIADWKMREGPLKDLASDERYINANMRIAANNMLQDESRRQADQTRQRGQDIGLQRTRETLQQRDRYLAYKQYALNHPNHKIMSDIDGYMYSVNPQTDEANYITTPDGNPVTYKDLPPEEQLRLKQQNAMAQIGARGAQSRQTAETVGEQQRQTVDEKAATEGQNIEKRGAEARKTKATPSGGTSSVSGVNFGSAGKGKGRRVTLMGPNGTVKDVDEKDLAQALKDNPTWRVVK